MTTLLFRHWILVLASMTVSLLPLQAQDTRGALVPGTKVTLADGSLEDVADLAVGSVLLTWTGVGAAVPGKVTTIRRTHADSYLLLKAGDVELQASGAHRIVLAGGKRVRLDTVKVGDKVWLWGGKGPTEAVVSSLRLYPANLVSYDLTLEEHRLFIAGGIVVGD